jgi:hypothetical protein
MYKIYSMFVGDSEEKEQFFVHGEETAVEEYARKVFTNSDYGAAFEFNTQLQYEKTVDEFKKEFPEAKFVRAISEK